MGTTSKVIMAAGAYALSERAWAGNRKAALLLLFFLVALPLSGFLMISPFIYWVIAVILGIHSKHPGSGYVPPFVMDLSWAGISLAGLMGAVIVVLFAIYWVGEIRDHVRLAFGRNPAAAKARPVSLRPEKPSRPSRKTVAFQKLMPSLLQASDNDNRPVPKPVFAYLNGRGISSVTIHEAWQRKFFLALDGGIPQTARKKDLSKNGLLDAKGNLQVIPDHPLVFPLSRSGGAVAYSLPKAGAADTVFLGDPLQNDLFYWKGDPGNTEAMILKGPIDLLSAVDLGNRMTMFALHGYRFSESRIVQELLSLGCTKVWLGMDADEAGQAANATLVKILHAAGLYCMTITHDEGCRNINDVLRYRRALAEKEAETAPAKESARKEAQAQQTTAVPVLT